MRELSRNWKRAGAAIGLLAAAQLVPVSRVNPPVTSDLAAPAPLDAALRRACYDCHSHETRWPWYAWVAPASWKVAHDVEHAREELNFSAWRAYRPDKRARLLEDMLEEVEEDTMPPGYYVLLHPEAELSPAEREALRSWVHGDD